MRSLFPFLGLFFLLSAFVDDKNVQDKSEAEICQIVNRPVKPDSIIREYEQEIRQNIFVFSIRSDDPAHVFLSIRLKNCPDSCLKLTHDLLLEGGGCNDNISYACVYELRKDTLLFYAKNLYTIHFDDSKPKSSLNYEEEIYVFDHTGRLTMVKRLYNKHTALKKQVEAKLSLLAWQEK